MGVFTLKTLPRPLRAKSSLYRPTALARLARLQEHVAGAEVAGLSGAHETGCHGVMFGTVPQLTTALGGPEIALVESNVPFSPPGLCWTAPCRPPPLGGSCEVLQLRLPWAREPR